jgi:parvulin-like peptidyl-prolyl isomerase
MGNRSSILLAAGLLLPACSSFTSPPEAEVDPKPAALAKPPPPEVRPAASVVPPQPAPAPPKEPEIRASHILIAYKGARGAAAEVARTKEQAKKRAENVLKKTLGPGADFAALAKQYSDDPGSGPRGGDLGTFTRVQMVKPFADAAFLLRPGQVSEIVESEFGFHIIKRSP